MENDGFYDYPKIINWFHSHLLQEGNLYQTSWESLPWVLWELFPWTLWKYFPWHVYFTGGMTFSKSSGNDFYKTQERILMKSRKGLFPVRLVEMGIIAQVLWELFPRLFKNIFSSPRLQPIYFSGGSNDILKEFTKRFLKDSGKDSHEIFAQILRECHRDWSFRALWSCPQSILRGCKFIPQIAVEPHKKWKVHLIAIPML